MNDYQGISIDIRKQFGKYHKKIKLISTRQKHILTLMFDDLPVKKITEDFPRDLENMSIDDLQGYIVDLKEEITRAESDIQSKKASQEAAASVFK
ncbi:MAG: DUF1192 family protein [Bdellovibrionales bacterium]